MPHEHHRGVCDDRFDGGIRVGRGAELHQAQHRPERDNEGADGAGCVAVLLKYYQFHFITLPFNYWCSVFK